MAKEKMVKKALVVGAILLSVGMAVSQQTTTTQPQQTAPLTADSKTHEKAVLLIQLTGAKELLQGNLDNMIETGKEAVKKQTPGISQEFVDERGRCFKQRINVDDYVNVLWEPLLSHRA